jgi:SNF2 family DNA or RNA helicase
MLIISNGCPVFYLFYELFGLGKQAQFRKTYELPVLRNNDPMQSAILKKLIQPFILRRLKTD